MRSPRGSEGFTLLEILIVVTIVGVLMAVLAPTLISGADKGRRELAIGLVEKLGGAVELYHLDAGSYPTTDQGLAALVRPPTLGPAPREYRPGGYAQPRQLKDPWGGDLVYRFPGEVNTSSFDLCSLGPDGQPGGEGSNADICNYEGGSES